jgi:hypothetical protein
MARYLLDVERGLKPGDACLSPECRRCEHSISTFTLQLKQLESRQKASGRTEEIQNEKDTLGRELRQLRD